MSETDGTTFDHLGRKAVSMGFPWGTRVGIGEVGTGLICPVQV